VGEQRFRHWFDGFAMLHKFSFQGGRVDYAGKYLETKARASALAEGRITYTDFATDPCRSLFARAMAMFTHEVTDNAKVSIGHFADRFLAMTETAIQVEFDPETLKSVGVFQYEDAPVGQMTTAHPHIADGFMYNVVTRFGRASQVRAYRVDREMHRERLGAFGAAKPSYMHSFGMTPNYLVVTEFPLVVNPLALMFWLKPFIENFAWEPRRGTPFTVLDRHTGEVVARVDADPFFAFHHVNAFERGDELVLDIVAYPDADIVTHYYLERLTGTDLRLPHGRLTRYTVPLKGGRRARVRAEVLSDACIELPHIDYAAVQHGPRAALRVRHRAAARARARVLQPAGQDRHRQRHDGHLARARLPPRRAHLRARPRPPGRGPRRAAVGGARRGRRALVPARARRPRPERARPRGAAAARHDRLPRHLRAPVRRVVSGPLIELRGVRKTFPLGEREVTVLDDVSLTVERGEFVAIVGASGSGKSTLLNMITGIDRPSAGEVRVAGTALHELDENRLAIWRGEHVGVVFQFFQLLPALTLLQNVVLPMDFAGRLSAGERRSAPPRCWRASASRRTPTSSPAPSRAVSSSARPSPARWPTTHRCWSRTSRPATSTAAPPTRCWPSSTRCAATGARSSW
jgi:carotenoid cleavage dioxygenase-like enzyme